MSDTVPVTINLPKPPEGWEWGEPDGPGPDATVDAGTVSFPYCIPMRRVQPPERTVMVLMLESDARGWATSQATSRLEGATILAAREALAKLDAQRECGLAICSPFHIRWHHHTTDGCSHSGWQIDTCRRSAGHPGDHSPEPDRERADA